jgi:hypothetical protein
MLVCIKRTVRSRLSHVLAIPKRVSNRGMRTCLAIIAFATACGASPDERPLTLEVVTLEVLAPSCGQVQCHSTTTRTENYAFDTVEGAKAALVDLDVDNPTYFGGTLFEVLNGENDREPMPFDAPLAEQDYDLLAAWIAAGTPNLAPY